MKEIDSRVVRNNGHYERQAWHRWQPDALGEEIDGFTGRELVTKRVFIKPVVVFEVHHPDDEFEFQYNPARNLP